MLENGKMEKENKKIMFFLMYILLHSIAYMYVKLNVNSYICFMLKIYAYAYASSSSS